MFHFCGILWEQLGLSVLVRSDIFSVTECDSSEHPFQKQCWMGIVIKFLVMLKGAQAAVGFSMKSWCCGSSQEICEVGDAAKVPLGQEAVRQFNKLRLFRF